MSRLLARSELFASTGLPLTCVVELEVLKATEFEVEVVAESSWVMGA
jgi:hypothetical protein